VFVRAFLADADLAGGLFHLGAHSAKIVRGRNDGEKEDQYAGQGEQVLQGSEPSARGGIPCVEPEPVGRQGQEQPRKVKQQFHEQKGTDRTCGSQSFRNSESESMWAQVEQGWIDQ
jgi:hypothetical protein